MIPVPVTLAKHDGLVAIVFLLRCSYQLEKKKERPECNPKARHIFRCFLFKGAKMLFFICTNKLTQAALQGSAHQMLNTALSERENVFFSFHIFSFQPR